MPSTADALLARLSADELGGTIQRLWQTGAAGSLARALAAVGAPALPFDPDTPEGRAIFERAAESVTKIDATTRAGLQSYVTRNRLAGGGPSELAALIRKDPSGLFKPARARTIARTEAAYADTRGSILGYRQSGRVKQVRVFDGDGCGWTGHDDPDKAHGSIRDLDDVDGHELAHPNCRRSFAPVVEL